MDVSQLEIIMIEGWVKIKLNIETILEELTLKFDYYGILDSENLEST